MGVSNMGFYTKGRLSRCLLVVAPGMCDSRTRLGLCWYKTKGNQPLWIETNSHNVDTSLIVVYFAETPKSLSGTFPSCESNKYFAACNIWHLLVKGLFVGNNKCKLRPQIVRVLTLKTEIQSIAYLSQSQGLHDCVERQEDRRDNRAQTEHNRAQNSSAT